jgi:hypothetical protein
VLELKRSVKAMRFEWNRKPGLNFGSRILWKLPFSPLLHPPNAIILLDRIGSELASN